MASIVKLLIISILILGYQTSSAQTKFAKLYTSTGYDYGRDIIQSFQDSGLVVTGSSSSFITGTADALILKTDSVGNFEWSYAYGGPDSDWGNKIIQTQDTGYVLAGYTNSYGAGGFDCYIVKTDQYGQHLWDTTFGGTNWDIAHSIIELPNKNLVIVGETQSFGNGNKDAYIFALDSAGNFLWEKTYGGSDDDVAYDLDYDGDSLWVVGSTASFSSDQSKDAWILNFNLITLDTNYTEQLGGPAGDDEFFAVEYHSPRIYFAGTKTVSGTNKDSWLRIEENANNILINDITYPLGNDEIYYDVQTSTAFSTVFCVGSTNSAGYASIDGNEDIYLNAYTFDGIYLNYKTTFGEEGVDIGYGIAETYLFETMVYVADSKFHSTGGNGILIFRLGLSDSNIQPTDIENMQITTSIESDEELDFDFALYPNPANSILNIKCAKPIQEVQFFNINGSLISTSYKQSQVDISSFKAGMYIVKVKVDDRWIHRKIVKQ